jgi:5-methylcytosine-specific restriction endonuclease McrBC GTP-binding regulatory subunit McrB
VQDKLSHSVVEAGLVEFQDDDHDVEIVDEDEDEGEIFEESEVLDYIKDYIRKRGYYFDDETLFNYHICLKTRPFVILAGLSGTGKSKLAQLYAEALGQSGTFKRLPVRPNWNDDRYLLGHLNTITGDYITEPAVEFILAALAHPNKLYSLCLDEMNLAHVEYYFSQFLSAMEGDRPEERSIALMSQRAFAQLQEQYRASSKTSRFHLPSAEINLPDNLIFTGTINVDETTQPISDKVIDRANTIEFFNVDLNHIPEPEDPGEPLLITNSAWQSYRATSPDTRYHSLIVEIDKILKQADMGLGYRIVNEIELYVANSQGLLDPLVAFDLQCKQRILPRIHGPEFIEGMLIDLITFSKKNKLVRTEKRLQEMKNRLKRDGYTNFWR